MGSEKLTTCPMYEIVNDIPPLPNDGEGSFFYARTQSSEVYENAKAFPRLGVSVLHGRSLRSRLWDDQHRRAWLRSNAASQILITWQSPRVRRVEEGLGAALVCDAASVGDRRGTNTPRG